METILTKHKAEEQSYKIQEFKSELKQMILDKGIVFGSGLSTQKKPYKWNLDTKEILLEPRGAYLASALFMEKLRNYQVDYIGGLTLASHLIASSIVFLSSFSKSKYSGFLIRKQQKKYGMLKHIEGIIEPNSDVVIVDDVLNAAGFATKSIETVEKIGCKVKGVIVLINFQKKEYNKLIKKGYNVEQIFTLSDFGLDAKHVQAAPNMFKLAWKYGIINKGDHTAPKSTPFINENGIYVGSDQNKIISINFSGNLKWDLNTEDHPHGVHCSPVIFEGKVICGSYNGFLYVLNEKDGTVVWMNKACDFIGSSPVIDTKTRTVYIGLENKSLQGTMSAFDFDTGNLLWEFITNNYVHSKAEVFEDLIVFGSNDFNVYCCNKNDGTLIWKFLTEGEVKGSPIIDAETKKVYAASFDGNLYCLELYSGKLLWKKKLGIVLYNNPLIYGDIVFVGSYSGQVSALDKNNGKVKWFFMTEDSILSSPIENNGIIFIGSNDRNVYALESESGKLLWKYKTNGFVTSSPRIYKDKLFVNSNDGNLYCFEKNE